jgi:hypothetical protein
MNSIRKAMLASLVVNAAVLFASQTVLASSDITVNVAPPTDRHEAVPKERSGYVWAPGHWEWTGRFYSWTSGSWISQRRGEQWIADRWEQNGSQWHYLKGHWADANSAEATQTLQAHDQR